MTLDTGPRTGRGQGCRDERRGKRKKRIFWVEEKKMLEMNDNSSLGSRGEGGEDKARRVQGLYRSRRGYASLGCLLTCGALIRPSSSRTNAD